MSCEVQPGGLSTTTNPLCKTVTLERSEDALDYDLGGVVAREAGGEAMTATTLVLGDLAHVDRPEGAHADAPRAVGGFLEHARDLGLAGPADEVDQALDLFERDVVTPEILLRDF